jgi:uncharacterized protein (TIGR02453 family)
MIQPTTISFLKNLKKNNTKEWFDANRKVYDTAKEDFIQLTQSIINQFGAIDESIAHLQPKDCIFRINRDIRFSKDKSPYKTNMGMHMASGGKKSVHAGYYFHCEPGKSFVGGGLWMPMPEELKKLRQEIDYNWADFKKIISTKKFKDTYKDLEKNSEISLSRPPKGYEDTNPAIEYIKLKCFVATAPLGDTEIASKTLEKTIIKSFETLKPLIDFINEGL